MADRLRRVSFLCSPVMRDRALEEAHRRRTTLSDVCRRALAFFLRVRLPRVRGKGRPFADADEREAACTRSARGEVR